MIVNIKTFILKYKYSISYLVGASLLMGIYIGIVASIVGLAVDYIYNSLASEENNFIQKKFGLGGIKLSNGSIYSFHIAFFILLYIAFFYTLFLMITSNIPGVKNIIYNWLVFSDPLAEKMSAFVPAIQNYTEQLKTNGDTKLYYRIRHVCAVAIFMPLLFSPLIFRDILRYSFYYMKDNYHLHNKKFELLKAHTLMLLSAGFGYYSARFSYFDIDKVNNFGRLEFGFTMSIIMSLLAFFCSITTLSYILRIYTYNQRIWEK